MPLPFFYLGYRYIRDGGKLGYFGCSETVQAVFAAAYLGFYAVLAVSLIIDMIFYTKKEPGWLGLVGRVRDEDYIRVLPIPKSLWPVAFANIFGVVIIYVLSVIGCWLKD